MSDSSARLLPVYVPYLLQSMAQAISWQFVTYFVKHDLGVESFLLLTVVWAVPALVTTVAVNVWGAVSDRIGRKKPFMLVGFIGYASTFLLYSQVTDAVQYLVVACFGALMGSASVPVGQAYVTTGTEKRGERLGYLLVVQSAGWSVGALSSGVLYDVVGMRVLYVVAASLAIVATVSCGLFVMDMRIHVTSTEERVRFSVVMRRPGMARLTLAASLSAIGNNAIACMLMIMVVDELGGTEGMVGLANALATLLAVVFTGFVGKLTDRKGPVKVLVIAYSSYVCFATAFALATDPWVVTALYALPIYPLASTAAFAYAARVSKESERSTSMGLVNGAQNAGAALGPIIGGLSAEFVFLRVQPISWLNMLFNLLALLFALSLLRVWAGLHAQDRATDTHSVRSPIEKVSGLVEGNVSSVDEHTDGL
ncbi:MAG: MFS transporter [Candidatus Thorarchaeota archaeon]|nr:MFS transporter [Candidatus Thorarchaeota archaeon]